MSRLTLWMALVAALLVLGCAVTEATHASKPASSSELSESLPNNRRMLSPTSRRLLSRDGGGFSDSEMEAMHDSMWRWRNSMDRSRRRGGRGGGMMGGRGGGGMMGGRGKAEKDSAEKEAFPEGDCGGNGGGESQEAPHLELIRRSMRAVGLIAGNSGDLTSAAATTTNGGSSSSVKRFGGRRMSFPLMHMHHGRMHVPMMGMGMGNMNEHPMHFRADTEPPEVAPLRSSTPCAFFSSICDFFRRVFGAPSPAIELPSNEDTVVGSSGIGAEYPRRMMRGRAALDTASMSTFDAFTNSLVNGLVMENDQEHAMTDVPGMDEMMGDRDGTMMEGDDMMMEGGDMMMQGDKENVMMPTGDGMVGRHMDDKEMEEMEGMMGGNRMMLRGGNA